MNRQLIEVSNKDRRLLDRVKLPVYEKVMLHNYFLSNPEENHTLVNLFLNSLLPMASILLGFGYMYDSMQSCMVVACATIWVILSLVGTVRLFELIVATSHASKNDDRIMERMFIKMLPGGSPPIVRLYHNILWLALFILPAINSYFVTSMFVGVTFLAIVVIRRMIRSVVYRALKRRVRASRRIDPGPSTLVATYRVA